MKTEQIIRHYMVRFLSKTAARTGPSLNIKYFYSYSHKAIAALMTSEENDDAANQISRTSVVMKLKEAHKKNEFLSSQQIIKELEIANSSVTAAEEISSVGRRRSKALKALQASTALWLRGRMGSIALFLLGASRILWPRRCLRKP